MKVVSKTDKGIVRSTNQDCFSIDNLSENAVLVAVCDGMGGANGGNVASQTAIEAVSENITAAYRDNMNSRSIKNLLQSAIYTANSIIYRKASEDMSLYGMGTTIVLALIKSKRVYIAHVGDSRAYILNEQKIEQLTRDHSLVQIMVEKGQLTEEQAKSHPKKNLITKALGAESKVECDYLELSLEDNDSLLFCTDGLTNTVEAHQIYTLYRDSGADEIADVLIDTANKNGGSDNITAVLVTI